MKQDKILVYVNGGSADDKAVEIACLLSLKNKSKVSIVYVIEVKHSLPLDATIGSEIAKAEVVLDRAAEVARSQDWPVDTDVVQSREAGPAIVEEAIRKAVSLIVIGESQMRRFGQFSLGTVVPYVLKEASCPVLVYRDSVSGGET